MLGDVWEWTASRFEAYPGFEAGNTAFDFNAGGYMQARPLNLNTNGVTITCWVNPTGGQVGSAGLVFQNASWTGLSLPASWRPFQTRVVGVWNMYSMCWP